MFEEYQELVNLSRLALSGRKDDVELFVRRLSRRVRKVKPTVADQLDALLSSADTSRETAVRGTGAATRAPTPIDLDTRMELVRPEYPVVLANTPIWSEGISRALAQIVSERASEENLLSAGLRPTRSVLLTGAPGVGKSLAAKWLAHALDRSLLTLDLAAVMSSYLGRTGANVKQVLDHAKRTKCVLLLDEFDAVAKRRDDRDEIGELKRLVTVLLQEIDEWPATGLLVAATNHPDLLDPAIWRRFEMVIEFPLPSYEQSVAAVKQFLGNAEGVDASVSSVVAKALEGESYSNIEREILRARRESVVTGQPLTQTLQRNIHERISGLPVSKRKQIAVQLLSLGLSQYEVNSWTGVHRSTMRAAAKSKSQ